MRRLLPKFLLLLAVAALVQTATAQQPVALVTKLQGQATQSGQPIQLLGYLNLGSEAKLDSNGEMVLSYLDGDVRVSAVGPCRIKLGKDGPTLLEGTADQVVVKKAGKRVGAVLPSHLDIGTGGHLRRGELNLHLSDRLLPDASEVPYSSLPSFRIFHLTVSDASSFEEVLELEREGEGPFAIPPGTLEPGKSYDFLLQATSDSGSTKEVEKRSVVVLGEDLSHRLDALATAVESPDSQYAERAELLAVYLQHGLDTLALEQVERLLEQSSDNSRLKEIREILRGRLQYQD